jgi:hypothetical protein
MHCRSTKPLTDPETGQQFLADWRRLADVLMKAAEQNANPFTTPLPKLVGQGPAVEGLDAFRPAFSRERQRQLPTVIHETASCPGSAADETEAV